MGLDMYLFKKGGNTKNNKITGACGGLFPIAPSVDDGFEEIGYWRKAYTVCEEILNRLDKNYEDIDCEDLEMDIDDVEYMIGEAEYRLGEDGWFEDDWEEQDWKDTLEIFKKAKKAIEEEGATIYYHIWY